MIEKGARRMLKKNGKMQAFVRFATVAVSLVYIIIIFLLTPSISYIILLAVHIISIYVCDYFIFLRQEYALVYFYEK